MPGHSRRPDVLPWAAALALVPAGLAGCAAVEIAAPAPATDVRRPVPTAAKPVPAREPAVPNWVGSTPAARGDHVFFRGWAEGYYADEHEGFDRAERNALDDAVKSIAVHVDSRMVDVQRASILGGRSVERQEIRSEVETWASGFVRKLPGRKEYYSPRERRYYVLIAVPKAVVEPTEANLVRFIRKNHRLYVSQGEDVKALDSLKTLVRLDPSAENRLRYLDYLKETGRWTEAKEYAEVLAAELEPGSDELTKVRRLLPLLGERSRTEDEVREKRRAERLRDMRIGVAAFHGRETHPDLERRMVESLRGSGFEAHGVTADVRTLTVKAMTEDTDKLRGFLGDSVTHVVAAQVEVLRLLQKKDGGRTVDYYASFVSGAFVDLRAGKVIESFVRDTAGRAAVRSGDDLEARTRACRETLAQNATASAAGRMPRLVREHVRRR